ncbi:CocE/NonD family hydrolase C-terminal non-catalytic domain-containing protein [Nocardia sp. NPDC050630]|uniref:CocE/NonD family hydrolase C-terminal non-catalytic domain-containing protein n=1 Tax=Nocardia sp. NPDC050630 TaxID=3364321 RepID=UPI0037B8C687
MPPKVTAYQMAAPGSPAAGWRGLSAWPAPGSEKTTFRLSAAGGLTADSAVPAEGAQSYEVGADGTSGSLTYTSEPIDTDRRVITGRVEVTLDTAFSAWDGNLVASLAEVSPDGTVTPIPGPAGMAADAKGYLKASHRDSDRDPLPVVPGRSYPLHFEIPSHYWEIGRGNRLQLTITSASPNVVHDAPAGTVTVRSGGQSKSGIALNLADVG